MFCFSFSSKSRSLRKFLFGFELLYQGPYQLCLESLHVLPLAQQQSDFGGNLMNRTCVLSRPARPPADHLNEKHSAVYRWTLVRSGWKNFCFSMTYLACYSKKSITTKHNAFRVPFPNRFSHPPFPCFPVHSPGNPIYKGTLHASGKDWRQWPGCWGLCPLRARPATPWGPLFLGKCYAFWIRGKKCNTSSMGISSAILNFSGLTRQ